MAELKDRYDVIVVGAGMGGLTCGALLARQGKNVLVCEQHIKLGGCVCGFQRKGFTFDAIHFLISQCGPGETLPAAGDSGQCTISFTCQTRWPLSCYQGTISVK